MRRLLPAAVALAALGCQPPASPFDADDLPAGETPAAEPSPAPEELPVLPALPADLTPFERAIGERMGALEETMVEVEMWAGESVVGHGSGVFVSAAGDVLTAAHVVNDAAFAYKVVLPGGERRPAQVIAMDPAHDAAILRAPGAPTVFFARTRARPPQAGEWVVCAGHGGQVSGDRVPMRSVGVVVEPSFAWTVTEYGGNWRHRVVGKTEAFHHMLRTDCATAPGMSGGPVVDLAGELVGIAVGTHGVATPVEAFRHLLPRRAGVPETAAPLPDALQSPRGVPPYPRPAPWGSGFPSRDTAIAAALASLGAERSIVELRVRGGAVFPAVLASSGGLVVAPSVRLAGEGGPDGTVAAERVEVVDHPGARCEAIVSVEGEIALLRFSGLPVSDGGEAEEGLRPVGPAGTAALGAIVAIVDTGRIPRKTGFVTGVDRHPGAVAPDPPRWGCGTIRARFARAHPEVRVASAFAHDAAGMSRLGSLLVDRNGRPLGVEVASRADGLGFAVPWQEVLARFDPWLASPDPAGAPAVSPSSASP